MSFSNALRAALLTGQSVVCAGFIGLSAEVEPTQLEPDERLPEPVTAEASDEGARAIKRFKVPAGFEVTLFAAEPMLANPVAFCIDEHGRFYTSETYRYRSSALDIRHYMAWLEDDLASRTIQDREAMVRRHLGDDAELLAIETEVVRLIEDTDQDGKADRSTIFADGFNSILDGIASGVLARNGKVYFANIPNLWLLEDTDGDNRADKREALSTGYGVHFSLTGHDLHGLIFGPDGKLYFSVGDRGSHLKTDDGRVLDYPDEGVVYRCDPDGSNLELFARGLRNPQELAFDRYGNLFTGDNDSDQGDRERWVYVTEGSDSGWRVGYQHNPLGNAGPWNSERLWIPQFKGQAAYITPPIANIDDGPSGLVYNPGTGLPAEWDEHFFLCHFKGASSNSRVSTYRTRPSGAGFELIRADEFLGECLPTDVDFGPDGSIYFTDWHHGWPKSGKGRIYKVTATDRDEPAVRLAEQTRNLLAEGVAARGLDDLVVLLAHRDFRIRREAQYALAARGDTVTDLLTDVIRDGSDQLARIHGIWALGQIGRDSAAAYEPLIRLLRDSDPEIRAQAARVLGDGRVDSAFRRLTRLLRDDSPRARFFAAMALGKIGDARAVSPVLRMIRDNREDDPFLRHAGVMALTWIGDEGALERAASDEAANVRTAVLLAMRRLNLPEIARFLSDPDPHVVLEAARAINDAPVSGGLPALAALLDRVTPLAAASWNRIEATDPFSSLVFRSINANLRVGGADQAARLASFAVNGSAPASQRAEALHALTQWNEPHPRDRIVGIYRPLPSRDPAPALKALDSRTKDLLGDAPAEVRMAALEAVRALNVVSAEPLVRELVNDGSATPDVRVASLHTLAALGSPYAMEAVETAAASDIPALRNAAVRLRVQLDPTAAVKPLLKVLETGTIQDQQSAFAALSEIRSTDTVNAMREWVDKLIAGSVPKQLHLDIIDAAGKQGDPTLQFALEKFEATRTGDSLIRGYLETLHGGNVEAGRKVFYDKIEVSCARCHKVRGVGGDAGPDLSDVGRKLSREQILESILYPNESIAEGYETVELVLMDGAVYSGIVTREDAESLELNSPEDGIVTFQMNEIAERRKGLSGMPEGLNHFMSKREMRNLIEFLAALKR